MGYYIEKEIETQLKVEFQKIEKETGVTLPSNYEYYCGLYRWPKWLRKILSKKFNASCMLHDIHHVSQIIDDKTSDKIFLENCKKQSVGNLFWECIAYVFYVAVRILSKTKKFRKRK